VVREFGHNNTRRNSIPNSRHEWHDFHSFKKVPGRIGRRPGTKGRNMARVGSRQRFGLDVSGAPTRAGVN